MVSCFNFIYNIVWCKTGIRNVTNKSWGQTQTLTTHCGRIWDFVVLVLYPLKNVHGKEILCKGGKQTFSDFDPCKEGLIFLTQLLMQENAYIQELQNIVKLSTLTRHCKISPRVSRKSINWILEKIGVCDTVWRRNPNCWRVESIQSAEHNFDLNSFYSINQESRCRKHKSSYKIHVPAGDR
jgi:hypothetical protein